MVVRFRFLAATACVTLLALQACSSGNSPTSPQPWYTNDQSSIVSLNAVSPTGPATLTSGQSVVTLKLTVSCDAPAGNVCQAGFDFIAADGSRVARGGSGGFGQAVAAGTHTVKIGGAVRPEFTGQTVGVHVALYGGTTAVELAHADYREKELKYMWTAP